MGLTAKGMAAEIIELMRSHGQWLGHAAVEALGNIDSKLAVGVLAGLAKDNTLAARGESPHRRAARGVRRRQG
jgi:hypothetical protein